jgi:ribosomal protein S18 acetylase RimI-like enzyme
VNDDAVVEILDVTDPATFDRLPPCADPRFDHRSCDYWEDEVRGSKASRPAWWQPSRTKPAPKPQPRSDNPFAPASSADVAFNPFDPSADEAEPDFNPFAPAPEPQRATNDPETPSKLRLLDRGRAVFGSYAKVLTIGGDPAVYTQFGPLSAYPRAQSVRELYPRLPSAPLPAVITCIAATEEARGRGLAARLVEDVVADLAGRGFSAIEAYPDLALVVDEASAATPAFWESCGFELAAGDERFPVMRRELE